SPYIVTADPPTPVAILHGCHRLGRLRSLLEACGELNDNVLAVRSTRQGARVLRRDQAARLQAPKGTPDLGDGGHPLRLQNQIPKILSPRNPALCIVSGVNRTEPDSCCGLRRSLGRFRIRALRRSGRENCDDRHAPYQPHVSPSPSDNVAYSSTRSPSGVAYGPS